MGKVEVCSDSIKHFFYAVTQTLAFITLWSNKALQIIADCDSKLSRNSDGNALGGEPGKFLHVSALLLSSVIVITLFKGGVHFFCFQLHSEN